MKNGLLLACVALTACATSKDIYLSDGSVGHNIECSGTALSTADCYQKAGELCGANGYIVLDGNKESTYNAYTVGSLNANNYQARGAVVSQSGSIIKRNLFIKCKG